MLDRSNTNVFDAAVTQEAVPPAEPTVEQARANSADSPKPVGESSRAQRVRQRRVSPRRPPAWRNRMPGARSKSWLRKRYLPGTALVIFLAVHALFSLSSDRPSPPAQVSPSLSGRSFASSSRTTATRTLDDASHTASHAAQTASRSRVHRLPGRGSRTSAVRQAQRQLPVEVSATPASPTIVVPLTPDAAVTPNVEAAPEPAASTPVPVVAQEQPPGGGSQEPSGEAAAAEFGFER
jgi:hypothetical protein